jgi:hypothetical protein
MHPAALIFLLGLLVGGQIVQPLSADMIFLSNHVNWTSPPRSVAHDYKTANGSILILRPTGEFEEVNALFYRERNGEISIDLKGGYSIHKGVWSQASKGSIRVKARLIYTSAPRTGQSLPGTEEGFDCTLFGSSSGRLASRLSCEHGGYSSISTLGGIDTLDRAIQFQSAHAR